MVVKRHETQATGAGTRTCVIWGRGIDIGGAGGCVDLRLGISTVGLRCD